VKKTSIYLDPELDRKLTRFAAARGISKAEAVRRSIEQVVDGAPVPRIRAIGIAEGPGDVSENLEQYLLESDFGRD
jgi:predicted transcriptional regulator